MNETWIQIIVVAAILAVVVIGIVNMKSPSKGGDAMSTIISEIQKVVEPQVKEIREVGKKSKLEIKKKKSDKEGRNLG